LIVIRIRNKLFPILSFWAPHPAATVQLRNYVNILILFIFFNF
jgi:hypothetical protein